MDKRARLESLTKLHRELDKEIKLCYSRYIDDPLLNKMKKEKLSIKEEIETQKKEEISET